MDRLPFTLPDFTRYAWVSDDARETWEPRLTRITTAWREIEWRAVVAGVRRCAIAMAAPEEFLEVGLRWAGAGLTAVPVEIAGSSGQPYSATTVPLRAGEPFAFRFVVGRPDDTVAFVDAWERADQAEIGALLGYPACCREFFQRVWVDDAMVDTTWPMARNGVSANGDTTLEVAGPWQANILWRWMGVRSVPHLPCRFDCEATVAFADELVAVGRELGFTDEMDWLTEVLSWSVEWSALHGIAEIKTPILKVSTRTDATACKYTVRRRGVATPAEARPGLSFPFETPVTLRLSATRGYRKGLEHGARTAESRPPWYASDNGFPSRAAMEAAHGPIVDLAASVLVDTGGDVLDLGCGNGALLASIAARVSGVRSHGIDVDPERIDHARVLHPGRSDAFVAGDLVYDERLWPDGRRYALALLMPGRLLEVGPERAAALLARLRDHCDRVLAYAYGDWCERPGGFVALLTEAGLRASGEIAEDVALVEVASELEVTA